MNQTTSFPLSARQTTLPISTDDSNPLNQDGHSSTPHQPLPKRPEANYKPTILDFVHVARSAGSPDLNEHAPWLLEQQSINSSTPTGSGASFSVTRMAVPRGRDHVTREIRMFDGVVMSQTSAAPVLPKAVAYKTARIRMNDVGEPADAESGRAAVSVLTEIAALAHRPLAGHANIVKLLGLAWGSNPYDGSFKLPVIVLEYADLGTVADMQGRLDLESGERLRICLDVANGLDVLHRCGIVHGDVKAENVLMFSAQTEAQQQPSRKYVAKLADFGFSVVGHERSNKEDMVRLGGTEFWRAPETPEPLPLNRAAKTDVYSFGLFAWRLAIRGTNPLVALLLPPGTPPSQHVTETRKLKASGDFNTDPTTWLWRFIAMLGERSTANIAPDARQQIVLNAATQMLQLMRLNTTPQTAEYIWKTLLQVSAIIALAPAMREQFRAMVEPMVPQLARVDVFISKLGPALENCLSVDPDKRDLGKAIRALDPQVAEDGQDKTDLAPVEHFKSHSFGWLWMRNLDPDVQTFIFTRLRERQEDDARNSMVNPEECFCLASMYINGYGTRRNHAEAVRLLQHAAKYGMQIAKANYYRFATSLGINSEINNILEQDLVSMALKGSRNALQDLGYTYPELAMKAKTVVREIKGGVGAPFFSQETLLHEANIGQWLRTFNEPDILVKNFSHLHRIQDYRVNRRGDGVLHMAASMGKVDAVRALLDNFPALTVDQLNDSDETPLLCSCRAGHAAVATLLIERGADASIVTPQNESPLHWLISFDDADIPVIGELLLKNGASLKLCTTQDISHSEFPNSLMVDRLPPSIPLHWAVARDKVIAVRFLVDKDPDKTMCIFEDKNASVRPVDLAALWHMSASLKVLVEAMEEAKLGMTYTPLVVKAVQGADMFSMILRNGSESRPKFKETLDFLMKRVCIHSISNVGGNGRTLLFNAVSLTHDIVVEYLLDPETDHMIEEERERRRPTLKDQWLPSRQDGIFHLDHINQPCGMQKFTPFHEAVRLNNVPIIELLLKNGADPNLYTEHPFASTAVPWTALHIFAFAGHNDDLEAVKILIDAGVPVDGPSSGETETPLLVALQHNSFNLASELIRQVAQLNAKSQGSGLRRLEHPTSILGHLVATAEQNAVSRIKHLLTEYLDRIDFVVEPHRQMTALHHVARAHKGVSFRAPGEDTTNPRPLSREDYDFATNREVAMELLRTFSGNDHLNAKSTYHGWTALHFAVDSRNANVAALLLEHGADKTIRDENGLTALELAEANSLHVLIKCDGCGMVPLRGKRWCCETCRDHDVCDACRNLADTGHSFRLVALRETLEMAKGYPLSGDVAVDFADVEALQGVMDVLVQ